MRSYPPLLQVTDDAGHLLATFDVTADYVAAKHGPAGLAKALANELGDR
jgi:hypothetical protein